MTLVELQDLIRAMYGAKDERRGAEATFLWFMEEVGELEAEFADVLAWLATLANVAGVDLGRAVAKKYGRGCPGCGRFACACDETVKP